MIDRSPNRIRTFSEVQIFWTSIYTPNLHTYRSWCRNLNSSISPKYCSLTRYSYYVRKSNALRSILTRVSCVFLNSLKVDEMYVLFWDQVQVSLRLGAVYTQRSGPPYLIRVVWLAGLMMCKTVSGYEWRLSCNWNIMFRRNTCSSGTDHDP